MRAALLGVFILIGPGMAVAARLKLPLFASLAAVPTVGVFDRQAILATEDYYGYASPGSIRQFEDQVRSSPAWKLYKANDVTTIFKFDTAGAALSAP